MSVGVGDCSVALATACQQQALACAAICYRRGQAGLAIFEP